MLSFRTFQDKVVEYRHQSEASGQRAEQATRAANQAEIRLRDTEEVLRTLEDRLRLTEVGHYKFLACRQ